VIETEPIANYLLLSMGFKNSTPTEFTKAIEEERDVPPLVLKKVEDAIKLAQVNFLAMNPTTETAQTNSLANQAKQNGVAVLYFAELPGKNQNYISWMNSNIEQVRKLTGVDQ
jgi:zinc/manganese transport system substrate-binding protein